MKYKLEGEASHLERGGTCFRGLSIGVQTVLAKSDG
jgi:hypothetical protein